MLSRVSLTCRVLIAWFFINIGWCVVEENKLDIERKITRNAYMSTTWAVILAYMT